MFSILLARRGTGVEENCRRIMAAKQLVFNEAARQSLLGGVEKWSRAVKATLGPKGAT
jgi:hypothetical protein